MKRLIIGMIISGICAGIAINTTKGITWPLKLSDNNRYLADQDNIPFFINGDTGWFMITNGTANDAIQYMDDRKAKDFNAFVIVMLPHPNSDWVRQTTTDGHHPFYGSWNLNNPNDNYFNHARWIIEQAAAREMLVMLQPIWLSTFGGILDQNSETSCYSYGQYLGNKLADNDNIIWLNGGDSGPGGYLPKLRQIINGINSARPDSIHSYHSMTPESSRNVVETEPWLNLNSTYCYFPGYMNNYQVYNRALNDYNRSPAMPSILFESTYENEHDCTPQMWRRQAYWAITCGEAGHFFGSNPVYNFPYRYRNWASSLNSPGSNQMRFVFAAFHQRAWYQLIPDQSHLIVTGGYGSFNSGTGGGGDDYVTAAATPDGSLLMAYIPGTGTHARTLTVNMTRLAAGIEGKWFNPTTGQYIPITGLMQIPNQNITSPGNNGTGMNDWLLILESPPINPPANLAATANPDLTVSITWSDQSDNETGFVVQRRPWRGFDQWHEAATLSPGTTRYTDTDRIVGRVVYTYRVGASQ